MLDRETSLSEGVVTRKNAAFSKNREKASETMEERVQGR